MENNPEEKPHQEQQNQQQSAAGGATGTPAGGGTEAQGVGGGASGNVSQYTSLTPNVAAGVAAVFPLIGGIVLLIVEKKDEFVRFWSMQSIYFGGAMFVLSIILTILAMIPIVGCVTSILGMIVYLGALVLWIITIIKAFQGERWLIPVLGEMAEKQLKNMPQPGA